MKKEFSLKDYKELVDFRDYEKIGRKQAIQAKCKECCGFSSYEAHQCKVYTCALWPFISHDDNP